MVYLYGDKIGPIKKSFKVKQNNVLEFCTLLKKYFDDYDYAHIKDTDYYNVYAIKFTRV